MFTETRRPPPVDLAFALSASSLQSRSSIKLMRDVIKAIIEDYGTRDIHYSFIIYGSDASTKYSFAAEPEDPDYLQNFVEFMPVINPPTSPHVALEEATKAFKGAGVRANATKVLVVMTDMKGDSTKEEMDAAADPLKQMRVKVIVVGIGANVDDNELVNVTGDNNNVITVPLDADKDSLTKTLMKKVFQPGNSCLWSYFLDTCFHLFGGYSHNQYSKTANMFDKQDNIGAPFRLKKISFNSSLFQFSFLFNFISRFYALPCRDN